MTGDTAGLFGIFSDLFVENTQEFFIPKSTRFDLPPLQKNVRELCLQLQAHHNKHPTTCIFPNCDYPEESAAIVFTTQNFEDCIWAYFTVFHPQHPFIHWPTFDIYTFSRPLLLAVALAGSVHCPPSDAALLARTFFHLAEDFIFDHLRSIIAKIDAQEEARLQSFQAALLIVTVRNKQVNPFTFRDPLTYLGRS
ncbi:hypothetical protein EK21DRAFT_114594 [Setomelanomma holmii]|uniref:Xylanolytic transcriptional activator regulatory domain-containing protein n=1 Tax=Setomelanomma holmii TaxID=210430 RepID=A0A9P4H3P1_9PLEO|nr:hypothetical protein EK21DRAFT_114594 [Setomelanomma holmii]